jgi:hypothetical protein
VYWVAAAGSLGGGLTGTGVVGGAEALTVVSASARRRRALPSPDVSFARAAEPPSA